MYNFVIDFLDWFVERLNDIKSYPKFVMVIAAIAILILSLPLWIFHFVYWLIFVKLIGGNKND